MSKGRTVQYSTVLYILYSLCAFLPRGMHFLLPCLGKTHSVAFPTVPMLRLMHCAVQVCGRYRTPVQCSVRCSMCV